MSKTSILIVFVLILLFGFVLRPPIDGGKLTSLYGYRLQHSRTFHKGTDVAHAVGTPIRSISWGIVRSTGFESRGGNFVTVKHFKFIESRYYHLNSINVNIDQKVTPNTRIGTLGNTGLSTGPHLHYEIRFFGIPLPPHLLCTPGRVLKAMGLHKLTDSWMGI